MTIAHAAAATASGTHTRLVLAALAGIALIVVLIGFAKLHAFLSLTIGSAFVGIVAGLGANKTITSFGNGVGSTVASVGTLIALGAIFGKLLADSGGADQIVDTIVGRASARALPWAMALVGALIGLPMFFEIGLVLLMPVILLVARRSGQPLFKIAIPALAGLSAMHGLVPPHPGPLTAIAALKADLGLTLALGVVVAIPTIIIAGPLFGKLAARWVDVPVPDLFVGDNGNTGNAAATSSTARNYESADAGYARSAGSAQTATLTEEAPATAAVRRPSFGLTLATVLLPVVLMLIRAVSDIEAPKSKTSTHNVLEFLGNPLVALLIAVLVALFTLGRPAGMSRLTLSKVVDASLPPIAGIILIVAAGGGFKQVLVDTGIGKVIAHWVSGSSLSPLLLAWLVAVLIRIATGSATVATVTASGILVPVAAGLSHSHNALLVLAIGSGSLFLSHVNDAGFWLTKEYMGVSVGQNLKTWTAMECLISVTGLGCVLALSTIV